MPRKKFFWMERERERERDRQRERETERERDRERETDRQTERCELKLPKRQLRVGTLVGFQARHHRGSPLRGPPRQGARDRHPEVGQRRDLEGAHPGGHRGRGPGGPARELRR